jgi:hypothetical protein
MVEPYADQDAELDAERENADRLHATLVTTLAMMRGDERDCLRAVLLCPRASQLTLGHVIDGALALHEGVDARRPR